MSNPFLADGVEVTAAARADDRDPPRDAGAPAQISGGKGDPKTLDDEQKRKPCRCKFCGQRMTLFDLQHHKCEPDARVDGAAEAIMKAGMKAGQIIGGQVPGTLQGNVFPDGRPEIAAARYAADSLVAMLQDLQGMPAPAVRVVVYTAIETAIKDAMPQRPYDDDPRSAEEIGREILQGDELRQALLGERAGNVERPAVPLSPFSTFSESMAARGIPPATAQQIDAAGLGEETIESIDWGYPIDHFYDAVEISTDRFRMNRKKWAGVGELR